MKQTPLKRTKRLNPISKKQRGKNRHWNEVTDEKCEELGYICQWCGEKGQREASFYYNYLDGHHIIKRRYNIHTKENCYPCHRIPCHGEIEGYNVDVSRYPNRKVWLKEAHDDSA